MRKLDYFWKTNKDWYHRKENGVCVINEDAPLDAQKSYQHYLEQCKEAQKRIDSGESVD